MLAVLLRAQQRRWSWRVTANHLAAVLVPALILGGVWWVRNLDVYGGTDFTGLTRHDEVTVGQPRTDVYIDTMYGGSLSRYLDAYATTTFHSFWGQFGWMAIPMPDNAYRVLLAFSGAIILGAMYFAVRARQIAAFAPTATRRAGDSQRGDNPGRGRLPDLQPRFRAVPRTLPVSCAGAGGGRGGNRVDGLDAAAARSISGSTLAPAGGDAATGPCSRGTRSIHISCPTCPPGRFNTDSIW